MTNDKKTMIPPELGPDLRCNQPPALEDWELLMHLDGEGDRNVEAHLSSCVYCSGRAESLGAHESALRARLYRADCPPAQEIGDFEMRMLEPSSAAKVRRHLGECPHCARELAQLRLHLRSVRSEIEWSGTDMLQSIVGRVASAARGLTAPMPGLVPAEIPLRGVGSPPLLIEADGALVTLDLEGADNDHVRITGQFSAEDQDRWTGAVFELRQGGEPPYAGVVDDLGGFRFAARRSKPLDMRVIPSEGPDFQAYGISLAS